MPSLVFPGTTVTAGSPDVASVKAIQQQLIAMGCGPLAVDGDFGAETFAAVEQFQARFVDGNGQPLQIDGKVGPTTWSVLFGQASVFAVAKESAPSALLQQVITVAIGEIGTMEVPLGSNQGPEVDLYITTTGLNPADNLAWCACFVYFCFNKGSTQLGVANPCVKTGGVLAHWQEANSVAAAKRILPQEAQAQPSLIVPGTLFLLRTSSITGHMGIIEAVQGNQLTTIEGNTNDNGSREGIGVFKRSTRTIGQINLGFILYS